MEKPVVGKVTTRDKSTYCVRTCNAGEEAANEKLVSSQTGGKTYRQVGNRDAGWELVLHCGKNDTEIPVGLAAGQVITFRAEHASQAYTMIIDHCSINAGVAISLSCSANAATSYRE